MCHTSFWWRVTRRSKAPGARANTAFTSSSSSLMPALDTSARGTVAPYAPTRAEAKKVQPGPPRGYPSLRTGALGARPTRSNIMDFALFVPISMFFAIVLAIKVVVDARWRKRLVETNPSEELMKSVMAADEISRRVGHPVRRHRHRPAGLPRHRQQVPLMEKGPVP